jgi:hypothetical protein
MPSVGKGTSMRRKLITTAAAVGAMLGLGVGPATAAPPSTFIDETFDEEFVEPAESNPCGVEATIHERGSVRVTDYFDEDGNFVRGMAHVRGTTTVTTAYGQTIDRWSFTEHFDPESLTVMQAGNIFNVHPSDGGRILVNDSGRIVIDVTTGEALEINGPHDAWEGDFDALCEVIGP